MADLTIERLKELLAYDPETGVFTYRVRNGKNGRPSRRGGKVAGSLDNSVGYLRIGIDNHKYLAHRLAVFYVTGEWPTNLVDHDDLDGVNNRWSNIRHATKSQNAANSRLSNVNSTGFKGVSFCRSTNRYRADIRVDGKSINLGRFDSPETAHAAYVSAAVQHFGEYARAA